VPEDAIINACWKSCQPLLGTTLIMPDEDEPLNDADEICERLGKQLELIIDGGACSMEPTTVIDLTGDDAELVRQGRGDAVRTLHSENLMVKSCP
jgi:tRNA A37 threonylcarbamoyladenosine synthetase subunit TsaC/SUA5/YrdC